MKKPQSLRTCTITKTICALQKMVQLEMDLSICNTSNHHLSLKIAVLNLVTSFILSPLSPPLISTLYFLFLNLRMLCYIPLPSSASLSSREINNTQFLFHKWREETPLSLSRAHAPPRSVPLSHFTVPRPACTARAGLTLRPPPLDNTTPEVWSTMHWQETSPSIAANLLNDGMTLHGGTEAGGANHCTP